MRTVIGVVAVIAILLSAGQAEAQEGWGTTQESGTGESGDWGSEQQQQQQQGGWGDSSSQATDSESPPTQNQQGWDAQQQQQQTAPPPQTTTTQQAPPPPPPTTTVPAETAPATPTGAEFRLQHRIGLGAHNHMSGAFLGAFDGLSELAMAAAGTDQDWATPWLNLSLTIAFNRVLGLDIFFGFTIGSYSFPEVENVSEDGDKITSFEMGFGPRLLITLAEGEQSRLYTGFGAALLVGMLNSRAANEDGHCPIIGCGGWDSYGFAMAAPIGVEYRFTRIPNLAFTAEVNFHFVFQSLGTRTYEDPDDPDPSAIASEAAFNRIVVGLGNPKFEGSMNVVDFLSFLTLGFHYLI